MNRGPDNAVDIFVLGDVALPLVHDRLMPWEAECPGILQSMVLKGIAVDSPADAVALRLGLPEPPRNPVSRAGDLRLLGDHRLLCGDSTNPGDVRRLMNGDGRCCSPLTRLTARVGLCGDCACFPVLRLLTVRCERYSPSIRCYP